MLVPAAVRGSVALVSGLCRDRRAGLCAQGQGGNSLLPGVAAALQPLPWELGLVFTALSLHGFDSVNTMDPQSTGHLCLQHLNKTCTAMALSGCSCLMGMCDREPCADLTSSHLLLQSLTHWLFKTFVAVQATDTEKRKMMCTMIIKMHSLNLRNDGFFTLFG